MSGIDDVIEASARVLGVPVERLKSKERSKSLEEARSLTYCALRDLTAASFPEIARAFGRRHHATVLSRVNEWSELEAAEIHVRNVQAALDTPADLTVGGVTEFLLRFAHHWRLKLAVEFDGELYKVVLHNPEGVEHSTCVGPTFREAAAAMHKELLSMWDRVVQ